MPRATAFKSTPKTTKKPKQDPPPTPALSDTSLESPSPIVPKDLLLQIVLAKLEGSKTCDWFELSNVVNAKLGKVSKEALGVGKKGKKGKEEGWTGSELSELYQSIILPGLRSGKVIWYDGPVPVPTASVRDTWSVFSVTTKVNTPAPSNKRRLASATPDDRPVIKGRGSTKADPSMATPSPAKKRRIKGTSSTETKGSVTSTKTKSPTSFGKTKGSTASTATKTKIQTKGAARAPKVGGRAVRTSRRPLSYREDLVSDDEANVNVEDEYMEEEGDEYGKVGADGEKEEEDGEEDVDEGAVQELEDEGMEDDIGGEGDEVDEGAVQELENEGLEDDLEEEGVESGDQ